ncbi:MAG: hypothetical protein V1702_02480 [Candidatus Woesearchaeota archaeon]
MRFVPITSIKGYEKVAGLLTYPYCGVSALAIGSAAAKLGLDAHCALGYYRAKGKKHAHAWDRFSSISVDAAHQQFISPVVVLAVPTDKEPQYNLFYQRSLPISAGDFKRKLEDIAERGYDWKMFLPLEEFAEEVVRQLDFSEVSADGIAYLKSIALIVNPFYTPEPEIPMRLSLSRIKMMLPRARVLLRLDDIIDAEGKAAYPRARVKKNHGKPKNLFLFDEYLPRK